MIISIYCSNKKITTIISLAELIEGILMAIESQHCRRFRQRLIYNEETIKRPMNSQQGI